MNRAAPRLGSMPRCVLGVGLFLCTALALGADEPSLYSPRYILQVVGSLLLVLACLLGVLFLLKKLQGGELGGRSPLRVLGSLKVGTREKVVLLQAGERQLLLGVGAGSVRTLHVFDHAVTEAPDGFAAVLRESETTGRAR